MAITTYSKTELTVGAGKLFFNQFDANGDPTGERYLGNTPGFSLSSTIEKLDHFTDDESVSVKDSSTILRTDRTLKLETDNISIENLALFYIGDLADIAQASGAVTGEELTVKAGRYYQLGVSANKPTGVKSVSSVAIKSKDGASAAAFQATHAYSENALVKPASNAVYFYKVTTAGTTAGSEPTWPTTVGATVVSGTATLTCVGILTGVAGTDYELDADHARIYINSGSRLILDGETESDITADYTKAQGTYPQISGSTLSSSTGSLRFIADNTKGVNRDIYFPKIELTPDGDGQWKSKEHLKLAFNGEVLKDGAFAPYYIDGQLVQ